MENSLLNPEKETFEFTDKEHVQISLAHYEWLKDRRQQENWDEWRNHELTALRQYIKDQGMEIIFNVPPQMEVKIVTKEEADKILNYDSKPAPKA